MSKITISDATLRDGNHAIRHQLSKEHISAYAKAAEAAGIGILEVGHGNGLGASSMQVGLAKETDATVLSAAREQLSNTLLGVHVIPGFATKERDIQRAINIGVDVFRIASHVTEADITQRHISYVREKGKKVLGVLMMSHMAEVDLLVEEALKMEYYGAQGVVVMDSAGAYLPHDVNERITALRKALNVEVGFHGHNNLSLAVANSIEAINCGATMIDGCAKGFGAGAGNTQLEPLIAVCEKLAVETGVNLYKMLDASDVASQFVDKVPIISPTSVISGLSGVFSGFLKRVELVAIEFNVDPRDIFVELGKLKVVAGQEDMIIKVALELSENRENAQ
jgi:4-hydroxy 2-oxovalerate aldolase